MEINHLPVQHRGMAARITLRDIADKCECTVATVSRALRNRPEISPERRAQIKKVALEMGYVPDPALAALVQHRQSLRSERYLETLALISPDLSWEETEDLPRRMELISAIRDRASELGYKLDFIHLPEDEKKKNGVARILSRQGIRGLIILASDPPAEEISFPWDRFVSVRLYRPPIELKFTTVDTDLYQGIHMLLNKIAASRYRRPGLVMPDIVGRYTGETWPRYLAMIKSERKDLEPVPRFVFRRDLKRISGRRKFREWIEQQQPDVLLSFNAPMVLKALNSMKIKVPEDLALIDLDVEREGPLAGLMQSRIAIGRTAIDQLHSLLITNSTGLPDYPVTVKTAFHWVDGPSFLGG